ncbi:fimbria/pilus periplasmic chaperone [Salmonella enterica]|uniref:fimbria/pilus periplasmic chaperone n=1 Tax=Salmonella enterica TaxID=28901 RepID=UPI003F1D4E8F
MQNKQSLNITECGILNVVPRYQFSKKTMLLLMTWCMLSMSSLQSIAAEKIKVEKNSQEFGVKLGVSRLIYSPGSTGQSISVSNPSDYPMLVQSRVYSEDMKSKAPFVVTPPLFRLDGLQQNNLRIIRTGGDFAKDRETLQWLCVKGIPPKADDLWAKDKEGKPAVNKAVSLNLKLSVDNCIKLFVRPESIKGHPDDVASSLSWVRHGSQLKAVNDTPFYMNLSSLKIGNTDISDIHYVPPFSSYTFALPKGTAGKVYWTVVTDYGGVSKVYQADIK